MISDEQLIARLTRPDRVAPQTIEPGEALAVRLLVLVTAPLWASVFGAALLGRLVRGKRPLLVFHERVGYQRTPLWVPKIATAAIAANKRHYGGFIEVATGPPSPVRSDGNLEQWLRYSGIDELPQLALVLRGKMRIVGPRPVTPGELVEMADETGAVAVDVLHPGLVGLWQVLDRHRYELDERGALDRLMVANWSRSLQRQIITIALSQARDRLRKK